MWPKVGSARSRVATAALLLSHSLSLGACSGTDAEEEAGEEHHRILVTSPAVRDVPRSEGYVSQIHSRRHIEVRALDEGYLEEVPVQEGQRVRAGQLLFRIFPVLYRARLDAHRAEFNHAEIELQNARMLAEQQVISAQELALVTADRDRIRAELDLARAEFGFTSIVAPFDGLIDRQYIQQGSLVGQGDVLTTISDNEVMWVYFNVPEADYLRYRSDPASRDPERPQLLRFPGANIQLRLANAELFEHEAGDTVTVESNFDNTTGNVQFRVDFPNPEGLLLHGQTGTVLINDTLHDVLVIPQRAVFDILDRQYVYVVAEDGVAHQRELTVAHESDDIFVIASGLEADDRYVLDGVQQVRDGERLTTEFVSPEESLSNLRHHAE
ncbi:MAG TPA: efflux RND transporter periplasmic adaptor subunit [Myxococcales bacterium]|nr:efflux RND transporter periplasmic adaptor subunit [Myxococcales bacterium]